MSKIKIKTIWGIIECSHTNIKQSYDGESLIVKTNTSDLRIPNKDLIEFITPLYKEKKHAYRRWKKGIDGNINKRIDYEKCWKKLREWTASAFLSTCANQYDNKMSEIEKEMKNE